MPKSHQRKKKPTQPGTRAAGGLSPVDTPAPHALAAEATGGKLGFDFRGHRFTVDLVEADLPRAMFAMQAAARGSNISAQFTRMIDCFEAVLGADQVATLYDVAPDLFSRAEVQREFWEQFSRLTVGASVGERSAS